MVINESANNNIQGFIVQSLQTSVNEPQNSRFWLPGLLKNLKQDGKPVIPITVSTLDIGAMKGPGADYVATTIAGAWPISRSKTNPKVINAIPNPASPLPTMKMSSLTVEGLDNLFVVGSSTVPLKDGSGYQCTILVKFNAYEASKVPHTLCVTGSFDLHQEVCSSSTPESTQCDGVASATIVGQGDFTAIMGAESSGEQAPSPVYTDCFVSIVAEITANGTGSNRTPKVQINSIALLGPDQTGQPNVFFADVTLTNVQRPADAQGLSKEIQLLLNTGAEGSSAIITMVQDRLNTSDHLTSVSTMLTRALSDALDDVFGPVGSVGLPCDEGQQIRNPVDECYLDRMRAALNNPSGPFYVPTVVRSSTGPVLEPYQPGTIALPDMALPKPLNTVTLTQVVLESVRIAGLSNMLITSAQMAPNSAVLCATATLNALSNPPAGTPKPPATAAAQFKAVASGEVGQLGPSPTTITVLSSRAATTAAIELTASGDKVDDLALTFRSLVLDADPADIAIDIQTDGFANELINSVVNQDNIKKHALDAINAYIARELQSISAEATKGAISLIKSKLEEH